MPLNCGIVGLPNVGKSTIFNALTSAKAQAANYPFCTIDPNTGVVTVPDARLAKIAELIQPKSLVPTTMEFIDIAGLVEGASKGEGLGNQFLGHIRATDAICHVVRCFDDPEVVHVAGAINPLHDIDIMFDIDEGAADLHLDMAHRYELLSVFKEAIMNAAKHSIAKHIQVSLRLKNSKFFLLIEDDGRGFDINKAALGRGMNDMRRRAADIKALLHIESEENTGTIVKLEMPV